MISIQLVFFFSRAFTMELKNVSKIMIDSDRLRGIQNSEGKPTNILTRLASLEGDVKALTQAAMDKQENAVDNIPQAPDFKK